MKAFCNCIFIFLLSSIHSQSPTINVQIPTFTFIHHSETDINSITAETKVLSLSNPFDLYVITFLKPANPNKDEIERFINTLLNKEQNESIKTYLHITTHTILNKEHEQIISIKNGKIIYNKTIKDCFTMDSFTKLLTKFTFTKTKKFVLDTANEFILANKRDNINEIPSQEEQSEMNVVALELNGITKENEDDKATEENEIEMIQLIENVDKKHQKKTLSKATKGICAGIIALVMALVSILVIKYSVENATKRRGNLNTQIDKERNDVSKIIVSSDYFSNNMF